MKINTNKLREKTTVGQLLSTALVLLYSTCEAVTSSSRGFSSLKAHMDLPRVTYYIFDSACS